MSDLLTSLDVVNQSFKKCMRGYDPVEVDEFLDLIASTLQVYAQKIKDQDQELIHKQEKLEQFETLRESIQEALIMAQRTADERVVEARTQAESILSDGRNKVDRMLRDAEEELQTIKSDMSRLRSVRGEYLKDIRAMVARFDSLLIKSEEDNSGETPDFTLGASL